MTQEQKESIDRTFAQFMQPDLGFRTGVICTNKIQKKCMKFHISCHEIELIYKTLLVPTIH